jgi:hypothetical protein
MAVKYPCKMLFIFSVYPELVEGWFDKLTMSGGTFD